MLSACPRHVKVRDGAKAALSQVGAVIKNPEINAIASQLIASMSDPEQMPKALEMVLFPPTPPHAPLAVLL